MRCGILDAMRFGFDMHIAGETPVSRCDPRVKILLLIVFSVAVLVVRSWWGIGALACVLVLVLALARIPVRRICGALVPIYVIAAISFAFNVIAHPDAAGLLAGLFVAVRMIVLVAGSFAVCFTATATQLVDALRSLLRPLRALRAPIDDFALTLSLASTGPIRALVSLGIMSPMALTANMVAMRKTVSLRVKQLFMYSSRSLMPSFF